LICTDAFLWLTHQKLSLINLEIVSATFGIARGNCPIARPLATRLPHTLTQSDLAGWQSAC